MTPEIKLLRVQRFRGIPDLTWRPQSGLNLLLGGGNVGKTTILEAIGLLLSPNTSYTLVDSDYHLRNVDEEFSIEAVMSLPGIVNRQGNMAWPWEWDGESAVMPGAAVPDPEPGQAPAPPRPPVYKVQVRGTRDLELAYEIVQPDESVLNFSVGLRREIGLVRLLGDDRSDRDLRLVQGSGLERLLKDPGLRARLGHELSADTVDEHLTPEAQERLSTLDTTFEEKKLPSQLALAFTGASGISINSLVGLTADRNGVNLPLASWGSGTRRLAALAIADSLQDEHPIAIIDELERGLEPYRQRQLVLQILQKPGQSFVTTHSAKVLNEASPAAVWYVGTDGEIGELPRDKIARHLKRDPEGFLARLTIVAEGVTEQGFLQHVFDTELPGWQALGLHIADGGGHDDALALLEALSKGGVKFAGFVDNEGRFAGRWQTVRDQVGNLLFQWQQGCLEQNVVPMFAPERIQALVQDPEGIKTGHRLRNLADRMGIASTDFDALTAKAAELAGGNQGGHVHPLLPWIIQASCGMADPGLPPDQRRILKAHASTWFKSLDGGREFAQKVRDLGVWQQLRPQLAGFIDAVTQAQAAPADDA